MPPARRRRSHDRRPRAVLYGRQSIAREESISLDLQAFANREHCEQGGYDVVTELRDEGISGRKWANRPGAVEAVRMIEQHEADVIVVWKWSRLSRNRLDLAAAFERIEAAGGQIESSTEPIDTSTAAGRFGRGVMGELAVLQSEQTGEQWKETHASRRARGVPAQGGDKFGYRRVRDARGRVTGYEIDEGDPNGQQGPPRPSPAEAVRLAYGWYLRGWGTNRITHELNHAGYRNLHGRLFRRNQMLPLLDAGFAAGLIVHRERDSHGRPVGERVYHDGLHPAIIDESTWTAYRAARRARAGLPARVLGEAAAPLARLMVCGDCGSPMSIHTSVTRSGSPDATRTAVFACSRWRSLGTAYARCVTTTRARAERLVREWLTTIAEDVETAAEADRKTRRTRDRARADASTARKRVAQLETELARLAVLRARDEIAATGYAQARAELETEHARAAVAAEEAEFATLEQPAKARPLAGRLVSEWDVTPSADLNVGLRKLLHGVWVFPPEQPRRPSTVQIVARWESPPEITPPVLPGEGAPDS